MDDNTLIQFRKQHIQNYRKSIIDIIQNNTTVLVDEDITSLFKTPPLDSMDLLKVKFLKIAKKNKLVFRTDSLNQLLESYRKNVLKCCSRLKKIRIDLLCHKVNEIDLDDSNIIQIYKKDFTSIHRDFKKIMKEQLQDSFELCILKNIDLIFPVDVDDSIRNEIILDITKYVINSYKNPILDSFDIMILVKDTTLVNSVKEQSEHYLFTLKNSRLLNDI